jgi:mannose/fructose/N-acetylgalactosamine-specific phosphotransferase system component IID
MLHLGNLAHFLAIFTPAFLGLLLGGPAVDALQAGIPAWLRAGIAQAGNILPALGFGILLSTLASPRLLPWFFLGFFLAAYLSVGVLGAAFVGILAAAIMIFQSGGLQIVSKSEADEAADTAKMSALVPQAERTRLFWRSFGLQSAFSFDRMQALGFTWILMPFLQKLYGQTEEFKNALLRHLTFFNTHMWIPGPIIAMVADLEARHAQNPSEVDTADIQAVKGSLMGPLAGIGDSMFHGTLRPLAGGVAASLALQGNPIAPVFFLAATNIVHIFVRWWSQRQGFRLGADLFERMDQTSLRRVMEGAAVAGLMGVGGLVGTWLNIKTGLTYTLQESTIQIQTMLDNIMPKLLPLLFTLAVYWAIRRGVRVNYILLALVIIGLVGGALHIIG